MTNDKPISIRLSNEDLERLQRLADKAGVTRHKLIVNMITTGLDTLEDLESVGVVQLALMVRNIENYLKTLGKKTKLEGLEKELMQDK